MIARCLPGLGDPMRLNIVLFNGYLERLPTVVKLDRGEMTDREMIEMESGIAG